MKLRVTFISIPIQNSQRLSQKEEEGNEVEIFVPAKASRTNYNTNSVFAKKHEPFHLNLLDPQPRSSGEHNGRL